MSFENQPWLGVLLIVIGVAFALLAYAVLINKDEEGDQTEDKQDLETKVPRPEISEEDDAAEVEDLDTTEQTTLDQEPPSPPQEPRSTEDETPEPEFEDSVNGDEPQAVVQPSISTTTPMTGALPIATLLRDESTGSLVLKIGDSEYRRVTDIRDEALLKRLKYAAEDFSLWFAAEQATTPKETPSAEDQPTKPIGMIDQINAILGIKLAESDLGMTGVRLVSDPSGSVKVYIGLDAFELDEVPNPQIRQLIQESVTEWEESQ